MVWLDLSGFRAKAAEPPVATDGERHDCWPEPTQKLSGGTGAARQMDFCEAALRQMKASRTIAEIRQYQ